MDDTKPFWKTKALTQMTESEWESLCDGCGKCCMAKLIDEDTDEIHFTTVACRLFDSQSCRCSDYANRQDRVSDCVKLTPETVQEITWLPATCAYRLVADGKNLPSWHPLVTGLAKSTHDAGISMRGRVSAFETDMENETEYLDHLVAGPL